MKIKYYYISLIACCCLIKLHIAHAGVAQLDTVDAIRNISRVYGIIAKLEEDITNLNSTEILNIRNEIFQLWNQVDEVGLNQIYSNYSPNLDRKLQKIAFYKGLLISRISNYSDPNMMNSIIGISQIIEPLRCDIYYFNALYEFRRMERVIKSDDYSNSFNYLRKALECRSDFPEALWLKSQIHAINGNVDGAYDCWKKINESSVGLNPIYYLYDEQIYLAIINTINHQLK